MSVLQQLSTVPPVTRLLTLALLGGSVFVGLLRASAGPADLAGVFRGGYDATLMYPWIVVVPGSVVWYPWTLLTAAFVEVNVIEVRTLPRTLFRLDSETLSAVCLLCHLPAARWEVSRACVGSSRVSQIRRRRQHRLKRHLGGR